MSGRRRTVSQCLLLRRRRQGERYAVQDFRGACHRLGCPACAPLDAERFVKRHAFKAAAIGDPVRSLLLTWPLIRSKEPRAVTDLLRFLDGAEGVWRSLLTLTSQEELPGVVLWTEYNRVTHASESAVLQPHIHVVLLAPLPAASRVRSSLASVWQDAGGKEVNLRPHPGGTFLTALLYARKDPLTGVSDDARAAWNCRVLEAAEDQRGRPAVVRHVGGPALQGQGFIKLLARAEFEQQTTGTGLLTQRRHPGFMFRRHCPAVRDVCVPVWCQLCPSAGQRVRSNGRTAAGTPRWRCQRCGASWVHDPRKWSEKAANHALRRKTFLRRAYRCYGSITAVVAHSANITHASVDTAIRALGYTYDTAGRAFQFTSYANADGTGVVNQVQRQYNGLGQLVTEYQSHDGPVTAATPTVGYDYDLSKGGRLTSMAYPDGRVLSYNYDGSALDAAISRLTSISDTSGTLEDYSYLGLSTAIERTRGNGTKLTYIKQWAESNGDAGDQYSGLDRFGRIIDQRWLKTDGSATLDRHAYGYDQNSNRVYRENLLDPTKSEVYSYDALDRLTDYARGTLNAGKTGLTGAPVASQSWGLDALGNSNTVTTDGSIQTRTHNGQNQITSQGISHNPNGNMTTDHTGKTLVYDAWNRLVEVKNGSGSVQTYEHDALARRVQENLQPGGNPTGVYYTASWQAIEERNAQGQTTTQYVWSPVYVDAMVERDRDTNADGTLDERLYVQQDANFNVTSLSNGTGSVVERYVYGPYGKQMVLNGAVDSDGAQWTLDGSGSDFAFRHGHQGGKLDPATGLIHFRMREYSPELMRWVQQDPFRYKDSLSTYQPYLLNPANRYDPTGQVVGLILDLAFIAHDTSEWLRGNQSNWEYAGNMLINALSLGTDLFTGGTAGPLVQVAGRGPRVVAVIAQSGSIGAKLNMLYHACQAAGSNGGSGSSNGDAGSSSDTTPEETKKLFDDLTYKGGEAPTSRDTPDPNITIPSAMETGPGSKVPNAVKSIQKRLNTNFNGRRPTDIWGDMPTKLEEQKQFAQKHLEDILNGPGEWKHVPSGKMGSHYEKFLPDGRGVAVTEGEGKFITFMHQEPAK